MTDFFIPPWLNIGRVTFSPVEQVGVSQSPFGGFPRTATLSSGRMRSTMEFTSVGGSSTQSDRGVLMALLARAGRSNRIVFGNPAFRIRGSFPTSELLLNNTFSSSTTNWSNAGENGVLSVADRVMRATRSSGAIGVSPQFRQSVTATQYAPYACRSMLLAGRGLQSLFSYISDGVMASQSAGPGLATAALVTESTSLTCLSYDAIQGLSLGGLAGDYFESPYMSVSRCALADAGANLLLRSDEFDNAAWTKSQATITANALASPDGASTADDLVDNAVNAQHYVLQNITVTASAIDIQISVAVKARNRNFCILVLTEASTIVYQCFDLSAGTVATGATGANWSNRRSFISSLGNGWYRVTMVARKTSSSTSIITQILSANADNVFSYAGSTNAAIAIWRGTASTSGMPARLVQTTTAVTSGESQLANGLHLKGLPASTNGLLLQGDAVEVITARGGEYKIVTAALNSDASGLGYLQFAPALRFSPSDNAAVIIQQPMGRFISLSDAESWDTEPGIITTASADFIEA